MTRALLSLSLAAAVALSLDANAQAQTPYGPDNGFFRPSPDVSLTSPRPANGAGPQAATTQYTTVQTAVPAQITVPTPAPVNAAAVAPAAVAAPAVEPQVANATIVPAPNAAPVQNVEAQMDSEEIRARRERAGMLPNPAASVGAAFDGTTDSRNR